MNYEKPISIAQCRLSSNRLFVFFLFSLAQAISQSFSLSSKTILSKKILKKKMIFVKKKNNKKYINIIYK